MSKPEPNENGTTENALLWECFLNWANTLEKLEKKEAPKH
jgi:hypothetical protein